LPADKIARREEDGCPAGAGAGHRGSVTAGAGCGGCGDRPRCGSRPRRALPR